MLHRRIAMYVFAGSDVADVDILTKSEELKSDRPEDVPKKAAVSRPW